MSPGFVQRCACALALCIATAANAASDADLAAIGDEIRQMKETYERASAPSRID